jgi:Tfp pilus assembly protein FimT
LYRPQFMRGKSLFDTLRIADKRKPTSVDTRSREQGFSILELVVVCAILMIVGAMVFVNGAQLVQTIRLSQSATSYANLLQQARIRAVRDDTFYSVISAAGDPPTSFIDLDPARLQTYTCTGNLCDPMMVFSQNVSPQPYASGPGLSNLTAQFLPANGQGVVVTDAPGPTFGPRGLPCRPNGGICTSLNQPAAYITFFENAVSSKWSAVTVTPAARIQVWNYDGTTWNLAN